MNTIGTVTRVVTVSDGRSVYVLCPAIAPGYELGPMEVVGDTELGVDPGTRVLVVELDAGRHAAVAGIGDSGWGGGGGGSPGSGVDTSLFSTKGTVLVASAPGIPVGLPVGTDGQHIVANSSAPLGVAWVSEGPLSATDPRIGAVGDGTTDNSAAFGRANTFLAAGNTDLYFPAGVYVTGTGLALQGGDRVHGAGQGATTLKCKAGASFKMLSTADDNVSRYYIGISDLGINGNAANVTGSADLIDLPAAVEVTIRSIRIDAPRGKALHLRGATGGAGAVYSVLNDVTVRGDVANSQGDGIVYDSGSSDANISQCDIGFFPNGAGLLLSGCPGSSISNVNCWQCLNGFYFFWVDRAQLTGCLADWSGHAGYRITGCTNLEFAACSSRESSQTAQYYDGFYIAGDATTHQSKNISFAGCRAFGSTALAGGGTKAWGPNYGIAVENSSYLNGLAISGGCYLGNDTGAFNALLTGATNVKIRGTLGATDAG